jgi:hypothetical protein
MKSTAEYWRSSLPSEGRPAAVFLESECRLLAPPEVVADVQALADVECVLISRGPWWSRSGPDTVEIMFETNGNSPPCIHIRRDAFIGEPPRKWDPPASWRFSVWAKARKVLELPAWFRRVHRIPHLRRRIQ